MTENSFLQEVAEAQPSGCDSREPCSRILRVAREIDTINQRLANGSQALAILPKMSEDIEKLRHEMSATREIVTAWGNIKGFGQTMKSISAILKVTATIVAALGTIALIVTHPRLAVDQLKEWLRP